MLRFGDGRGMISAAAGELLLCTQCSNVSVAKFLEAKARYSDATLTRPTP
jgi:hypothetical protein